MTIRVSILLNTPVVDIDVSITYAVVIFRVKVSCITSGLYRNDVLQKSNENVGGGGEQKET